MALPNDVVLLEIPREIPEVAKMSLGELKKELALALYAQGKISLGKACQLSEVSLWHFQEALGQRGIQIQYDVEDFAEDLATLRSLGRL